MLSIVLMYLVPTLIILLLYAIGITIALIKVNDSKDSYKNKLEELQGRYNELINKAGSGSVAKPQVNTQPATSAPASEPAPVLQQPAAPAPAMAPVAPPYKPNPVYTTPSLPTYTYSKSAASANKKPNGSGAVGISFAVGVLLMVIAAAVFISATWQTMAAGIKCIVLALVVAVVYGFSAISRKKLKLEKTSSVLYMLGSLITPLAVTIGFLAFESSQTIIMLCCCALSLGITGFIGYKIYGSKLQVAISYIGFVWVEIFIFMQALGNLEGFVVGSAVAAFVSVLIDYIKPKIRFFSVFTEITVYAAVIGVYMSSGVKDSMFACALITHVLYFAALLLFNKRRAFIKYLSPIVTVFSLFTIITSGFVTDRLIMSIIITAFIVITFAVYKLVKQDTASSNFVISCLMAGMLLLLSLAQKDFLYYAARVVPVLCFAYIIFTTKSKIERSIYCYLLVLSVWLLIEAPFTGVIPFYIILGLTAAALLALPKFKQVHLYIASIIVAVSCIFVHGEDILDKQVHIVILMSVAVALYGAVIFITRKFGADVKKNNIMRLPLLVLLIVSTVIITFSRDSIDAWFVSAIVLDIVFFVLTLLDKDNYFGIFPSGSVMYLVASQMLANDVDKMFTGALLMIVFVIIGRIFVCERFVIKKRIDWLTILAFFACLIPASRFYMSTFLLSLYIMSFAGRFSDSSSLEEKIKSHLKVILSLATGMLAISFAIVDISYTEYIDFEIRLAFLLAAAFIITFVIKPYKGVKWIWFGVVAIIIEVEACRAMANAYLIPLTLVSLCVCGIFIYSFIAKRRSWFLLAISNIAIIGVMFAVTFWESKLWWIYLLVLGAILIGTASVNENKRRRAIESGMEDKKIRLFDSWEW